jgi:hypothetical protein
MNLGAYCYLKGSVVPLGLFLLEKTILSESGVRRTGSTKNAFRFPLSAPRTLRLAKTHSPDDALNLH